MVMRLDVSAASTISIALPWSVASGFSQNTCLPAANAASVANSGGSMAHNNMAPYLVLHCIIATQGIFPSQN